LALVGQARHVPAKYVAGDYQAYFAIGQLQDQLVAGTELPQNTKFVLLHVQLDAIPVTLFQ
jgi:hypothetical protein